MARKSDTVVDITDAAKKRISANADPVLGLRPEDIEDVPLLCDSNGKPYPNESNAKAKIESSPQYTELHFDTFRREVCNAERTWTDRDDHEVLFWLQGNGLPKMALSVVRVAVEAVAHDRARDSLTDFWRSGLPAFDGVPRIRRVLVEAFGAEDTPLMLAASENFFISLAARAVVPGAKADHVLVLEGDQGTYKSTSLQILGGVHHREITAPLGSPDSVREIRSAHLGELSELNAMKGRAMEAVKNFLSRTEDTLIEKWKTRVETYPRRCVFVGTTNEHRYWDDPSGARRLVPVRCGVSGPIRLDLIREMRLMWFAEALQRFDKGEPWWNLPAVDADQAREDRQAVDPWDEGIHAFVEGPERAERVLISDILAHLGIATGAREPRHEQRVASILRRAGWVPLSRQRVAGRLERPWGRRSTHA